MAGLILQMDRIAGVQLLRVLEYHGHFDKPGEVSPAPFLMEIILRLHTNLSHPPRALSHTTLITTTTMTRATERRGCGRKLKL